MQIRVLGHLEASVEDRALALGGAKQRAVLAMLALEANRTVSAERLIEGLWGEQVPASAPKMLQNYVWRLRGDPLADLADEPFAAAEIRRLDELRETVAELALDADLAAGRHQEVIGRIE